MTSNQRSALAEELEALGDEIIERWVERVRRHLSLDEVARPELIDSMPTFLQAMAASLRWHHTRDEPAVLPEEISVARVHGVQRYRLGFDINAVVQEYSLLREAVFDRLETSGRHFALSELRVFTRSISRGIAEAVSHFASERDTDLRERERLERRARAELDRVFALSPDPLCTVGTDRRLKRVNPAYVQTVGFSEQQLLSMPLEELVHPDDRETAERAYEDVLQGAVRLGFRCRHRRADGAYVWLDWRAAYDPEAQLIVAAVRDVTAEKERSDFEQQLIGIVSHDLKSPLTVIRMDSTLLLRISDGNEQAARSSKRILANAERATRLINDLLDFTQARLKGGIPVSKRPTDLCEVIRAAVDEARASFPERELRALCPREVRGEWDPDRLAQVVTNLVSNALKYSPAGTPVTVSCDARPERVEVRVHNEGDPIAPEVVPQLFRPMQRGAVDADARGRSVGLGLFIVEQIVHAHGGSVDVASREGDGTTFTVRLPRGDAGE